MAKSAVLLVNLGSPDSTSVPDVRRYLDEFLSDDRVIDKPKLIQQFVLKCFILPKRPKASAHAYESIWTPEGSPLIVTSKALRRLVQERTPLPVALAMRYGSPSIPEVLRSLIADGVSQLFLIPLYPHYAMSSYETVVVRVMEVLRETAPHVQVTTLQPFFEEPDYIEALYQSARADLESGFDHLLFSYHGIPVRHLSKADSSCAHCGIVPNCCSTPSPAHATCYKAQCTRTTLAFIRRAGIPDGLWSISFQSRLGREPWLEPYTDATLVRLGEKKIQRLLVMTPAFVSDCLETLEEIAVLGREGFEGAGGGHFRHIPCLNEHPLWVDFLAKRISGWHASLAQPPPSPAVI